jgi:hypothetical protein
MLSILKPYTLESLIVSFSKFGECWRKQINALWSAAKHQSLRDKVFNLENVGHHFKSLLKTI